MNIRCNQKRWNNNNKLILEIKRLANPQALNKSITLLKILLTPSF